VRFLHLPPVLQLHLKRYEYDFEQDRMVKVGDRMDFPQKLDLSPFWEKAEEGEEEEGAGEYLLHAVVIHVGDGDGGHYYSYVDPKCTGEWYRFDDSVVTRVKEKVVLQEGYGGGGGSGSGLVGRFFSLPFFGGGRRTPSTTCAYMLQYVKKSMVDQVVGGGGPPTLDGDDL